MGHFRSAHAAKVQLKGREQGKAETNRE